MVRTVRTAVHLQAPLHIYILLYWSLMRTCLLFASAYSTNINKFSC